MGNLHFMHIVGWQPLETEMTSYLKKEITVIGSNKGYEGPHTDYPHVHTRIHGQI